VAAIAATGALAGAVVGAGVASASHPAARPAVKHLTVAFIPGATGVGFYTAMEAGVRAQAAKYGWSTIYQGSPNFTPSAQTPVVEAVCARHPAALLVAPTDPVAMEPAIKRCMSEGVLVVTVDTALSNTKGLVAAITSDNIEGGATAANFIAAQLHGVGQVATMSLDPTATTQALRVKGFVNELKAKYPKITVAATEYSGQSESTSETDASAVLSAHPQVKAFFGAAEPNAEGAALAAAGKHEIIVGYDADPSAIADLRNGSMSATIAQQPALEGQIGVEDVHDYLTGHSSAIKKSVELPNILITSADVKAGLDKKYYYPAG
jgi:ribose transport system substrate-binding protein